MYRFEIYRTLLSLKKNKIATIEQIQTIDHIENFYGKKIIARINILYPAIVVGLIVIDFLLNQIGYDYFKGLWWILFLCFFALVMIVGILFKNTMNKIVILILKVFEPFWLL